MEKALHKLARQLMAFDEDSLNTLWDKYARTVEEYEPAKRWEEAAVVFGLLQAVRWKNQLFNYNWKQWSSPGDLPRREPGRFPIMAREPGSETDKSGPEAGNREDKRRKVLRFRSRKDDESV